jgi:hypothetical protein
MNQLAHVESTDPLKEFRVALCQFAAVAATALEEAEMEVQRTVAWLGQEQLARWKTEVRQRGERLKQAELALKSKKYYLRSELDGARAFDEEQKAVNAARRRLEEAQQKLEHVRRWIPQLEQEAFNFKGMIQGMYHVVEVEIPNARAQIDRMVDALEGYGAVAAPSGGEAAAAADMTRPEPAAEALPRKNPAGPEQEPGAKSQGQTNGAADKDKGDIK